MLQRKHFQFNETFTKLSMKLSMKFFSVGKSLEIFHLQARVVVEAYRGTTRLRTAASVTSSDDNDGSVVLVQPTYRRHS